MCRASILLVLSLAACSPPGAREAEDPVFDPVQIEAALAEPNDTAHRFFRRINTAFAQAVCDCFRDELQTMPSVNLHGDPHLEQYAVTASSAGLADFDDSCTGPAVLDLARFGVSLVVAIDVLGWQADRHRVLDAFLAAYRDGLADPGLEYPLPAAAERLRRAKNGDRREFLDWATSLMRPLDAEQEREIRSGHERYVGLMLDRHPSMSPAFFAIKAIGRHEFGVGSSRTNKVLGRIEGPSGSPDDDVILEGKELRDLSAIDCVYAPRGDALRVVLTQMRMGARRDPYLAVIPRAPDESPDSPPFWVQSWVASYAEVKVQESFRDVEELIEIARDAGLQLARGHTALGSEAEERALREAQISTLDRNRVRLREVIEDLSERTLELWRGSVDR